MDDKANPLMDPKVVGIMFSDFVTMVAIVVSSVTSPTLLDVVWRNAAVVVPVV